MIIASRGENGTYEPIIRWLEKNHLKSHKIHLNHHKTVLFDDCWSMGDDSPFVLDRYEFNITGMGLKMPWNQNEKYISFYSLTEIYEFFKGKILAETGWSM